MLESGATGVLEQQQQVTEQQEAKEQEVIIFWRFQGWIAAGTAGPRMRLVPMMDRFGACDRTVRTPERAVVSHPKTTCTASLGRKPC
jgi:hypothetical protein